MSTTQEFRTFSKVAMVFTALVTIIAMSGVVYLVPKTARAATLVDGDVVKTADNPDVYILKNVGAKKFKRLVLNPSIFNSYGHLSWGAIKTVTQAELNAYTNSNLVLEVNADGSVADPKVYAVTSAASSDVGERRHLNVTAAQFESAGLDWDSLYKVNHTEALPSFYPTMTALVSTDNLVNWSTNVQGGGTTPTGTGLSVSLDASTPASANVAQGSSDVIFTKLKFMAGSQASTVSSVTVTRGGLGEDNDFASIKLWDGSTQLGSAQALNTVTHKATFTGLGWVVPASSSKVLTLTGSFDAANDDSGNAPRLGVAAVADVVASTSVSGSFPVYGNVMTLAGIAVGVLDVDVRTVPAAGNVISGSTEQEIASWTFAAVTEGFTVSRIDLTETGSSVASDISNIKLKVDGVQIGSTVSALDASDQAVFTGLNLSMNAGASKIVYAYADIAGGVSTTRQVRFEITETADVVSFGGNSGGSVTVTKAAGGSGTAFTAQTGALQTIVQNSSLTVTTNGATNPTVQAFVNGTPTRLFTALRFAVGAEEAVRVARLKLSLGGTGAGAVDVQNVTLYKYDELTATETQVGTSTSFVGTVATFGSNTTGLDSPGLFDIPKGKNVVIHVRADVSVSAAWTGFGIFVNEVKADGISSAADLPTAAITITAVDGVTEVSQHTQSAVGTLTVALAPSNPAAANVVPGKTGHEYMKVNLTANGEDIVVSTLVFQLQDNAAAAASGDFTNVKLWDGTTQLASTVTAPTSTASFSVNLTIKKDTTKTLTVTADVPTTAATAWAGATRTRLLWTTNATDIVGTGVNSTASVTATTADLNGNNMTALTGTLTISMSTNPPATTYVLSTAQAWVARLVLTAGTSEDLRISSIKVTCDEDGTFDANTAAQARAGSLTLYDGSTVLKAVAAMTEGTTDADTVTFSGLAVDVAKGTQKVLDLKVNVLLGGSVNFQCGVEDANVTGGADVAATGLSSNSTVYGASSDNALIAGRQMTFANAGTLTLARDAASPVSKPHAVGLSGKTNIEFTKFKMTANNEGMDVRQIVVRQEDDAEAIGASDNNFSRVAIYDGNTQVSGDGFFSAGTVTFNFAEGDVDLVKDASKVWTIKADLLGTSNGATSGDSPELYVGSMVAYGSSSGALADLTVVENTATSVAALTLDAAQTISATTVVLDNGSGADSGDDDLVGSIILAETEEMLITAITDGGTEDTYTVVRAVNGTTAAAHADNVTTQVYSMSIGNAQHLFRTKPTFALVSPTTNQTLVVGSAVEVMRFSITADAGGDVIFDGTNHNVRFNISGTHADNSVDSDTLTVRRVDTNASVGDGTPANDALDGGVTGSLGSALYYNLADMNVTVPAGTTLTFKVEADLADFEDDGDTFQIKIENAAADLSWDDDVSTDVTVANLFEGLPITAGAFVNPS